MNKVTTVGIDLAKNVFQVHGVDERGKPVLRKQLKRKDVVTFFANLPLCLIGMEACGSAHYWARKLSELGHTVRLMPPQFVKPYVKTNKNDRNDAEAICEAVARPNMRFVPVKSAEQQAVLALHRARAGLVKARTAQANEIRGLLAEYGIVMPKGIGQIAKCMPEILEDGENGLPGTMRHLFARLNDRLKALDEQVAELEREIVLWHRGNESSRKLDDIAGIGPITASAFVASVGDAKNFKNARQVPAWLGMVPRHEGTGGKARLGRMSKRGDVYLRTLLIHGARAVIRQFERKPDRPDGWLKRLLARRNKNVAAVALAAKNARIAWALLAHERSFERDYVATRPVA
ncbi:MAG: IS110 family transposase [Betaproteobacteria bacterium]|nr:IS110 family transposase [Betaproteobacteria bacterium]